MQATESQVNYLTTLFIDCCFTRVERTQFLKDLIGREVPFLDELSKYEASRAISALKEQKEIKEERGE